ncbi:MAG TPA: phosphoribosylanthranilate isomerase [Candidatus Eisenbacteria bacterium]|nr:phosphoribosylanthranilate isomerase [Candidatus Eisenbacteria bacterium]
MRTRIKVCGITNPGDATDALDAGADYLGLVFTESPRHVSLDDARRIRAAVPDGTPLVGVFADETPDLVLPIAETLGLMAIQVRGWLDQMEPPGLEVWHVIRGETLPKPTSLPMIPLHTYHLDAHDPVRPGGTGQVADWAWAKRAVESGLRVFVAGGLTAENVDRLVLDVRPFGVDASSGLESTVGRKSGERMRAFVERVRASDRARPKRS